MVIYYRKTTPKVKQGKVQRKNRAALTPTYYNNPQPYPVLDKEKPGRGYRHLIRKKDLYRFIDIIPEWEELAKGLNAVLLARGQLGALGWHMPGIVALCAWDRELVWDRCEDEFYDEHKEIFGKLGIPCKQDGQSWQIGFDERTARAFQLVHVLIHELGHHHDRMRTRSKKRAARGEPYAESYARRHEGIIIERYVKEFELY